MLNSEMDNNIFNKSFFEYSVLKNPLGSDTSYLANHQKATVIYNSKFTNMDFGLGCYLFMIGSPYASIYNSMFVNISTAFGGFMDIIGEFPTTHLNTSVLLNITFAGLPEI